MPNPFAHIELTTNDLAAAKKFYKKLFDWKLSDMPMGHGGVYTMIAPGKGPGGGMQGKPMPEAPVTWLPYVEVDNVKRTLTKAEKAGAKVVLPAMDIGSNGIIGVFVDPTGASLGVWSQAKAAAKKSAAKTAKKAAAKKTAKKAAAKTAKKKAK